ncbi:MAG: hypothetical protein K940chlam7_00209 [Chlamydiae bacterium]|nr:hypothetical protein [Chlamydiota bacterium]
MKKNIGFFKTTILGGLIFLLPLILLITLLGKAISIMMKVAEPLDEIIPVGSIGGIAFVNLLAIAGVILVCFFAGIAAKSVFGKKIFQNIEDKISIFPGYTLFKARMTGRIGKKAGKKSLQIVLVKFDDLSQIAFEIERTPGGPVVCFLPGSPDPWSGSIAIVSENQVELINAETNDTIKAFERIGTGISAILEKRDR